MPTTTYKMSTHTEISARLDPQVVEHYEKRLASNKLKSAKNPYDNLKEKGGPGRNHTQLLEVSLEKISLQHEVYPSRVTSIVQTDCTYQII